MIEINGISFKYNDLLIIDDVSLVLKKGHIYGIIGVNGAGKSTLLKCLSNIFYPNTGKILYNNNDIKNNFNYIKSMMFLDNNYYLGNNSTYSLLKYLSVNKELEIDYDFYNETLTQLKFDSKTPIRKLSKGNQRIAYLIVVMSLKIKNLILDEFLDGIDLVNRKIVKNLIIDYVSENDATIIIASHTTSDIYDLCDQIVLLSKTKITRNCTVDELCDNYLTFQIVLKENKDIDYFKKIGLNIYSYREFENIRWISIDNDTLQIELLNSVEHIELKSIAMSLEEVIFNEFKL